MNFVYELLRAGSTPTDSDSGAEVARKVNDNFKKVQDKFSEIDKSIKDGVAADVPIGDATTAGIVKSSKNPRLHSVGRLRVKVPICSVSIPKTQQSGILESQIQ